MTILNVCIPRRKHSHTANDRRKMMGKLAESLDEPPIGFHGPCRQWKFLSDSRIRLILQLISRCYEFSPLSYRHFCKTVVETMSIDLKPYVNLNRHLWTMSLDSLLLSWALSRDVFMVSHINIYSWWLHLTSPSEMESYVKELWLLQNTNGLSLL